jgi:putative oxidoreductase
MNEKLQGVVSVVGRVLLSGIFMLSAIGNKIPNFNDVVGYMEQAGVPAARLMLAGAIAFLIVGSVSVVLGLWARIGASLLLVFLVLATYYFHAFWNLAGQEAAMQQIQFMKNLALMGAMVFIIANGAGKFSIDELLAQKSVGRPAVLDAQQPASAGIR